MLSHDMLILIILPITKEAQAFWQHYKQNITKNRCINKKEGTIRPISRECKALSLDIQLSIYRH